MSDTVAYRPYRRADWEAVVDLDRRVMAPLGIDRPLDHPRRADLRDIEGHYGPPAGTFMVATVGSRIVAMGGFLREREGTARLKRLRVDPDYRRRGIAGDLVDLLEGRARDSGYAELMRHVTEHQAAARALYPRLGYELTEESAGDQGRNYYFRKRLT